VKTRHPIRRAAGFDFRAGSVAAGRRSQSRRSTAWLRGPHLRCRRLVSTIKRFTWWSAQASEDAGDLVIGVYVPGEVTTPTAHLTRLHTTYISRPGDFIGAPSVAAAAKMLAWYWISSVDVMASPETKLIVVYGDSITDGATSTPDTDGGGPSQLARCLLANKATAKHLDCEPGGLRQPRSHDGAGVSALARFDRDVLVQPGVQWLIVMEGIDDIGFGARATGAGAVTIDDLIAAHKQIAEAFDLSIFKLPGAGTGNPYGWSTNDIRNPYKTTSRPLPQPRSPATAPPRYAADRMYSMNRLPRSGTWNEHHDSYGSRHLNEISFDTL
jgi:lysophospholipase L1-like esterase